MVEYYQHTNKSNQTASFGFTKFNLLNRVELYLFLMLALICTNANAGNETIVNGSFIINMGVTPQTVANGLKPYGLIYDLIKNQDVPIKWIIAPGKVKDGIDFTYNSVGYKGGTFIVPGEFRTAAVNATGKCGRSPVIVRGGRNFRSNEELNCNCSVLRIHGPVRRCF